MDLAGVNSSGSLSRRRFGGDEVGRPPGGAGVDLAAFKGDERCILVYDMFRFTGNERVVVVRVLHRSLCQLDRGWQPRFAFTPSFSRR